MGVRRADMPFRADAVAFELRRIDAEIARLKAGINTSPSPLEWPRLQALAGAVFGVVRLLRKELR
jgi:hypothetical protein